MNGTPIRAWLLPTGTTRAYQRCNRWHRRHHVQVSATATDCLHCGLRWSW